MGHHIAWGPPVWQGQDPDTSSPQALPGVGLTGAKLLCFGTLTHLKEVVLGFPS